MGVKHHLWIADAKIVKNLEILKRPFKKFQNIFIKNLGATLG